MVCPVVGLFSHDRTALAPLLGTRRFRRRENATRKGLAFCRRWLTTRRIRRFSAGRRKRQAGRLCTLGAFRQEVCPFVALLSLTRRGLREMPGFQRAPWMAGCGSGISIKASTSRSPRGQRKAGSHASPFSARGQECRIFQIMRAAVAKRLPAVGMTASMAEANPDCRAVTIMRVAERKATPMTQMASG